jgi:hypothetical protein
MSLQHFNPYNGDSFEPPFFLPLQQLDWYGIHTRAGNRAADSDNTKVDSAILVQEFSIFDNLNQVDLLSLAIANSGNKIIIKHYL